MRAPGRYSSGGSARARSGSRTEAGRAWSSFVAYEFPAARLHADAELLGRPPGLPNAVPPFVPILSTRQSVDEVPVGAQRGLRIHPLIADAAGTQTREKYCRQQQRPRTEGRT